MNDEKPGSDWVQTPEILDWRDTLKSCVKGMMISFNLSCIMIGFWTFIFAVMDTKILKHYAEEQPSVSLMGDLMIIGLAVLLAGIAVMGCIGTVLNKVKILYLYVVCIIILVVLELMVASFVSVERNGLLYGVSDWLQRDFYSTAHRAENKQRDHDEYWDTMQYDYKCCGLNGPDDYAAIGRTISMSCCTKAYRADNETAQSIMYQTCVESATYSTNGCEDELLAVVKGCADTFFAMMVLGIWCEAIGMFLAMWVAKHINSSVKECKKMVKY